MTDKHTKESQPLILIVDDLHKNIQLLASILKNENYRVSVATDGQMAIEMLTVIRPNLILLDIMMPGMDGYEVCQTVKEMPETRDIPIIFLTAKMEKEDIVRGFRAGATDYVTKPFNTEELLARVRTQIKLQQTIAQLKSSLSKVQLLSGLLPICCHCKKIRNDQGYWSQVEEYISTHSEVEFSHGICPTCVQEHYPDFFDKDDKL